MRLDIWSDIACPWCLIGKRHLEQALATFAQAKDVEIVWRAYELDANAPKVPDTSQSFVERLGKKLRMPPPQMQGMIDRVVGVGKKAGIEFDYSTMQWANTFDGHRLIRWALDEGKQGEMKERLMRAYHEQGAFVADRETLAKLAADIGLDAARARDMLASDRYAREVREDQALARELGITGVPFFVFDGKIAVSGAQPPEVFAGALAKALPPVNPDGEACGPADNC